MAPRRGEHTYAHTSTYLTQVPRAGLCRPAAGGNAYLASRTAGRGGAVIQSFVRADIAPNCCRAYTLLADSGRSLLTRVTTAPRTFGVTDDLPCMYYDACTGRLPLCPGNETPTPELSPALEQAGVSLRSRDEGDVTWPSRGRYSVTASPSCRRTCSMLKLDS